MDGETCWSIENNKPVDFDNVKMYAGDNWYNPVDGKIKEFKVETNKGGKYSSQKDKVDYLL